MADHLVWHGYLRPTGTLFLDDLEAIEKLFAEEEGKKTWVMRADREIGSMEVSFPSIANVKDATKKVVNPRTLGFTFKHGRRDRDPFIEVEVSTGNHPFPGENGWRATVNASEEFRNQFDESARALKKIFDQAARSTWAQRHPKLYGAADWAQFIFLLFCPVPIALAIALAIQFDLWIAAVIGLIYTPIALFLVWICYRLRVQESWQTPAFNLDQPRSHANVAQPPTFLPRDIAIAIVFTSVAIVAPILAGLFLA